MIGLKYFWQTEIRRYIMGFCYLNIAHRTLAKALDIREKWVVWLWWELYILTKMYN